MALQLEIVTPEGKAFSNQVDIVVVPGVEGELGVLTLHAPLVTTLAPGELRYTYGGQDHSLAIGEGVVEVTPHAVTVLTDLAVSDAQIDEAAVEAALAKAQQALNEKTTDEEIAAVQIAIQKSLAQLHVKRRKRIV